MAYGTFVDEELPRQHSSIATRKPPYSSPPPVFLASTTARKSTARSGNNSPYIKGGVLMVPVKKTVAYKAIVGFYMRPVRVRRFFRDRTGRRRYVWTIVHKRTPVWGIKTKVKNSLLRIRQEDPGLLLKPNNLSFDSMNISESEGMNYHISNSGLPTEMQIQTSQKGMITGLVSGTGAIAGTPAIPWPSTSALAADLDRRALSGLYSRVNEEYTNVALLMAESGKTMGMVLSLFQSAISLVRSLKRLDLLGASRIISGNSKRDLANRWLAFQYGVRPLVSDIKSLSEDLERTARAWRTYRCSQSGSVKSVVTSSNQFSTTVFDMQIDLKCKHSVICDTNLSFGRLAVKTGFTNVPGLAWELIPFSFVIDWFYPLGNYLNSCRSFNSTVKYYWVTTSALYSCEWKTTGKSYSSFKGGGSGPDGSMVRLKVDRLVKATVPPLPLPVLNREPFNVTRAISALSLYLQRRS